MRLKLMMILVLLLGCLTGAPGVYQKKQFSIDATNWTPITAVMPCNAVGIKNTGGVSMLLRTTASDATTEDTLPASHIEVIGNLFPQPQGGRETRFVTDDILVYAKMSSGTATAVVSYLR